MVINRISVLYLFKISILIETKDTAFTKLLARYYFMLNAPSVRIYASNNISQRHDSGCKDLKRATLHDP